MQASLELFELDCNRLDALPPAFGELTGSVVVMGVSKARLTHHPLPPLAIAQH